MARREIVAERVRRLVGYFDRYVAAYDYAEAYRAAAGVAPGGQLVGTLWLPQRAGADAVQVVGSVRWAGSF